MSGIDLRHRLTESGSQLPIIFMTAVDDEATHREAADAGCVAYLLQAFSDRDADRRDIARVRCKPARTRRRRCESCWT
jgi:CheY-like chemotaxis protein